MFPFQTAVPYRLHFLSSSVSAPLVVDVSKLYPKAALDGSLTVCLSGKIRIELLPENEPDLTSVPT